MLGVILLSFIKKNSITNYYKISLIQNLVVGNIRNGSNNSRNEDDPGAMVDPSPRGHGRPLPPDHGRPLPPGPWSTPPPGPWSTPPPRSHGRPPWQSYTCPWVGHPCMSLMLVIIVALCCTFICATHCSDGIIGERVGERLGG